MFRSLFVVVQCVTRVAGLGHYFLCMHMTFMRGGFTGGCLMPTSFRKTRARIASVCETSCIPTTSEWFSKPTSQFSGKFSDFSADSSRSRQNLVSVFPSVIEFTDNNRSIHDRFRKEFSQKFFGIVHFSSLQLACLGTFKTHISNNLENKRKFLRKSPHEMRLKPFHVTFSLCNIFPPADSALQLMTND
jgi:hypothetical protein